MSMMSGRAGGVNSGGSSDPLASLRLVYNWCRHILDAKSYFIMGQYMTTASTRIATRNIATNVSNTTFPHTLAQFRHPPGRIGDEHATTLLLLLLLLLRRGRCAKVLGRWLVDEVAGIITIMRKSNRS
jgi:hypothetical protein